MTDIKHLKDAFAWNTNFKQMRLIGVYISIRKGKPQGETCSCKVIRGFIITCTPRFIDIVSPSQMSTVRGLIPDESYIFNVRIHFYLFVFLFALLFICLSILLPSLFPMSLCL